MVKREGFPSAGLVLAQIKIDGYNPQNERKHNEMDYRESSLRCDLRSTSLALEVKVYWNQVLFSNLKFVYDNFQTTGSSGANFTPACFSR